MFQGDGAMQSAHPGVLNRVWDLTQLEDISPIGTASFYESSPSSTRVRCGREHIFKCLSKAGVDKDTLKAEIFSVCALGFHCLDRPILSSRSQANVHQSLPTHPNIVTLYSTLETPSYLLMLLEYVPGRDLFYYLEESRDCYEPESPSSLSPAETHTSPILNLLSFFNPDQSLSHVRLHLISSMFTQMCQAVAACHAVNVFHRDIKPENFIVNESRVELLDSRQECRVVVKLTNFGLSTNDVVSTDMYSGSAPYMSYGKCQYTSTLLFTKNNYSMVL
jgi:serine/threonine protein kinase